MAVKKEHIVHLKGKDYPTWVGVLDAATERGLTSLTTTIVQIPTPENGNLAVVTARAEFGDGRVFEDVGDCSPASTSPNLAAAALRLASTRAKGRVLRDACNIGVTMYEELPGEEEREAPKPQRRTEPQREWVESRPPSPALEPAEVLPPATELKPITCCVEGCGRLLTYDEIKGCETRFGGVWYCTDHGVEELRRRKAAA